VRPSRLEEALALFLSEGLSVAARPVPGVVEISLPSAAAGDADRVVARLDALGRTLGGPVVFARRGAAWSEPPREDEASRAEAELFAALASSFDPRSTLNPGRVPVGG
jgi:FAD/FMN-containing dehydrogenase